MPRTLRVYSWPQTLTDWCVIQAFRRAGCPGCLRRPSILSAAFVAEVGATLRFRTLSYRTAEVTGILQAAAEPAYEQAGGLAYRRARDAATTAEDNFLRFLSQPDRRALHLAEREQHESALATLHSQFAAEAGAARRRSARRYWAEQRQQWLVGDFLSDLRPDHPLCRIAAFTPVWWELFVRCLRDEFARCHIPAFHVLDQLPDLRRHAHRERKKVLAAVVEEWREAHADELGLPAQLHYHVLARRGTAKARSVFRWFKSRGCPGDPALGKDARRALAEFAQSLPLPSEDRYSAN
jgi:hypothetical protein